MRSSRLAVRLLPLFSALLACAAPSADERDLDQRARELAQRFLIVDGHVDVPYRLLSQRASGPVDDVGGPTVRGDFDHPRAVAGGLDAPFMSIYTPAESEEDGSATRLADEMIDSVEAIARAHPERFALARTAAEVRAVAASGRIALLLGMENGAPIAGDLGKLAHFAARGVRYVTLCHGKDNHVCDSSYDARRTHRGLSDFGRTLVARMNELGVLVDVSHVSDDVFWQVIELSRAPVIASHSSLRHFVPGFERNMSDEMVAALGRQGGVVLINFGSAFLSAAANWHHREREAARAELGKTHGSDEGDTFRGAMAEWDAAHPFPYATVADAANHVERVVALAGVEHVGFGSDFDGVGDSLPVGLKDVSMYPNLIAELLRRGYSEDDIQKICGENALRVLEAAERVAREIGP